MLDTSKITGTKISGIRAIITCVGGMGLHGNNMISCSPRRVGFVEFVNDRLKYVVCQWTIITKQVGFAGCFVFSATKESALYVTIQALQGVWPIT